MKVVSAREAIRAIPDGARVVLPHGAVEPAEIYRAFVAEHVRFSRLRLYSGLQFGEYPFLRAGLGKHFTYTTWQASPKLRSFIHEGLIEVLPLRYRDVPRMLSRSGVVPPDVVVVQVSAPRGGEVSLGIALSFYRELIASASLVIAEVNSDMPWTRGATCVPVDAVHLAVESSHPLGEYRFPRWTPRDEQIVEHVLGVIPAGAWVQFGIGAIPDAVLGRLHEIPDANVFSGIVTDGLIQCVRRSRHRMRVITGEAGGTPALYQFLRESDRVEFQPVSVTHSVAELAKRPFMTSMNSAIEVDVSGQINGETIDGVQVSGVGGSLDFLEGTEHAPGGRSIIALSSTTDDGARSKIVRRLSEHTPVTIPRFCADYIVTEYGATRLRGKTLRERREALIAIAHPDWRDWLAQA
ncbi:MAG TPA: acetyl-CoA hydrolase/transferase C-terminal domain-containing protein [Candidatus Kryptonia bacterium]|nr:acetyl-CoA hydrolase/transferase C-terminal domain-containing protein [Candidatus Kryptonia bacterium]